MEALKVIDMVEAAYAIDASLDGWLEKLVAVTPGVDCGAVYSANLRQGVTQRATTILPTSALFNREQAITGGGRELPLTLWTTPGPIYDSLRRRLLRMYGAETAQQLLERLPWLPGVQDVVGMMAVDPSGNTTVLVSAQSEPAQAASPIELERWAHAGAHVMAGLRLRDAAAKKDVSYRPDGDAVITPDGRCLHAEGDATSKTAREMLRDSALAIDRARGSLRRRDADEALSIWRGLVDGRWSLVDRFDSDGRRFLIARRNEPSVSDPRGLTRRERQVVAFARLGQSNKLIAYTLGLAASTVATHLTRALKKLGLESRVALTRMPAQALELPTK